MIALDATRVRSVIRKELRDYRRNRFIFLTMTVMPVIFLAVPMVDIFLIKASASSAALNKRLGLALLYMLLIPVLVPATLAASTVVGEREQGTLEPMLTTPLRREEFILGKAAAVMLPSVAIAYTVFAVFLACVRLFANSVVATAVFHQGPVLLAQVLFTPLLAGWAIRDCVAHHRRPLLAACPVSRDRRFALRDRGGRRERHSHHRRRPRLRHF